MAGFSCQSGLSCLSPLRFVRCGAFAGHTSRVASPVASSARGTKAAFRLMCGRALAWGTCCARPASRSCGGCAANAAPMGCARHSAQTWRREGWAGGSGALGSGVAGRGACRGGTRVRQPALRIRRAYALAALSPWRCDQWALRCKVTPDSNGICRTPRCSAPHALRLYYERLSVKIESRMRCMGAPGRSSPAVGQALRTAQRVALCASSPATIFVIAWAHVAAHGLRVQRGRLAATRVFAREDGASAIASPNRARRSVQYRMTRIKCDYAHVYLELRLHGRALRTAPQAFVRLSTNPGKHLSPRQRLRRNAKQGSTTRTRAITAAANVLSAQRCCVFHGSGPCQLALRATHSPRLGRSHPATRCAPTPALRAVRHTRAAQVAAPDVASPCAHTRPDNGARCRAETQIERERSGDQYGEFNRR